MNNASPQVKYLKDYQPTSFDVLSIYLEFELGSETLVTSTMEIRRKEGVSLDTPIVLNGEQLELVGLQVNGNYLQADDYSVSDDSLTLEVEESTFELQITTKIYPEKNTALEGLYASSGNFCTQCEAEGFRRITYFFDRPDVLTVFKVKISADKNDYPYLLSNGNLVEQGEVDENRHWAIWEDPFKKPCYLFALVAGDFDTLFDQFTTKSGRSVLLQLYVEKGKKAQAGYAMESLKRAMKWDEEVFNLEYDLDQYMIVAVSDFNMGAMENKGLNIFNTKYVLASSDTATDMDFIDVESVIGHEYFHNWTGNRVTCRDWFQLSLKEGLTVFRDQEFTSDLHSRPVKRIEDVNILRTRQFAEDAGPMSHPVRPSSYIEMNNFYTLTVYNKGAEVIRMIHTLVGEDGFKRGMDLYFERHDGCAVTTDDFVQSMEDANGVDLSLFRRWYEQAGTPELTIDWQYNSAMQQLRVQVQQSCPSTPEQSEKAPFHIPLKMAILGSDEKEVPFQSLASEQFQVCQEGGETSICLEIKEPSQAFIFDGVHSFSTLSLLRDFSAPVKLNAAYTEKDFAVLMRSDNNAFAQWEACQRFALAQIDRGVSDCIQGIEPCLSQHYIESFQQVLAADCEPMIKSMLLTLPNELYIAENSSEIHVEAIHSTREAFLQQLGERFKAQWHDMYHDNVIQGNYHPSQEQIGKRSLKNTALHYLMACDPVMHAELVVEQYYLANNMTDRIAAFEEIVNSPIAEREEVIAHFYEHWKHEALVIDKWFATLARCKLATAMQSVTNLTKHEAFNLKNPNRVRSLIGAFAMNNPHVFHHRSGEGYRFLTDMIKQLDPVNPQSAARLVGAFNQWKRFDSERQELMKTNLKQILELPGVSKDVFEIVSKASNY